MNCYARRLLTSNCSVKSGLEFRFSLNIAVILSKILSCVGYICFVKNPQECSLCSLSARLFSVPDLLHHVMVSVIYMFSSCKLFCDPSLRPINTHLDVLVYQRCVLHHVQLLQYFLYPCYNFGSFRQCHVIYLRGA